MEYGAIRGIGKPISRLVTGTMIISAKDRARSFSLLDAVFEQGGNTFDTAHGYAGGESERGLGAWMTARDNREQVVIISKGCHHSADRRRVTPYDLASDIQDSLARLQTDYIDGYMLHRDDPDVPVGPIVEALNELHEEGHVRAFGASNWTHQRIAEANEYATAHGLEPFTISSPNFGLADQIEDPWGEGCVTISGPANSEARQWYESTQTPVLAYSSLARGLFSGRVTSFRRDELEATLDRASLTAYCHEPNFRRLERAIAFARDRSVTVPQVALAYVLTSPLNVFPIVGAASGGEYRENRAALALELSDRERLWLDLQVDDL